MVQLLNIHKFHSNAKNKDYCVIQVLRALTVREKNQGYFGDNISEEIFLPDDLVNVLSVSDIGSNINLEYEVFGGKANLVNITKGGK